MTSIRAALLISREKELFMLRAMLFPSTTIYNLPSSLLQQQFY